MKRSSLFMISALFAMALLSTSLLRAQDDNTVVTQQQVRVEHGVAMKTRDGVTLRADIYRPAGEGNFPVLLQRTPYNKDNTAAFGRLAASRGFMVVTQDVRGRYSSEGEWYPFKHESEDGVDAVEWAATLPHSDGRVGMFGGSYVGATQMLAAIGHPQHLSGICPVVTASNYHENWTYVGGALAQWFDESWTSGLAQDTLNRMVNQGTNAMIGSTTLPLSHYPLFNVSLDSGTIITGKLAPYFLDWLDHPSYDDYWRQWAIDEHYNQIQVPALTIAAWYDLFQGGSLRNYVGLRDHAATDLARRNQRLIITVGGHAGNERKIGQVDFGPATSEYNEDEITLRWYEYLFKGAQNEFADASKPVRFFVMGENQWHSEAAWPIKRAWQVRYYLHGSHANSASGNGLLNTVAAVKEAPDSFTYDPANPVPTVGGPLCCDGAHLAPGPFDQSQVETRRDVLVYSTAPLDEAIEVTGPVSLEFYAKSSAVDTDFTAKLVDVWPNGFAQNLTEGIIRARYRESKEEARLMQPGKVYQFKIDLWSTSNLFQKGHRIRLEISSSNFPRFDRNLNTGKPAASDALFVKATNTILHDNAHPSALILPVVPR